MIRPAVTRCKIYQTPPSTGYPAKVAVSGTDADASIDLAHGTTNPALSASMCWVIGLNGLLSSYKGATVDGAIEFLVRDYNSGGAFTSVLTIDFSSAGPAPIPLSIPWKFEKGKDVRITIKAGGSGVIGRLNLMSYWREPEADPVE